MQNMKFGVAASALVLATTVLGNTVIATPSVHDTTSTQAVVRVTTDQPRACTYRVSEGSTFAAYVNDVNPNLFTGANSDARPGSIITLSSHVFVVGTRTSTRAADGKFYSRALQADTLHWVGVTCGSDLEVSGTFRTTNPPLGNNGPELMPFDVTAFGNVAVPTINWTDRNAVYNDPMTGIQLRRMTDPGDDGILIPTLPQYNQGLFTYGVSNNGHWTNPSNAISTLPSSLATCDTAASCTPSDALLLVAVIPKDATGYKVNGGWDPRAGFNDFMVRMWGYGTHASATHRTVSVCWSIDSQTCFTTSKNIVLPQGAAAFAGTAPQSWSVQSPWSGSRALTLTNIAVANRTATVNFPQAHGLHVGGSICVNGIRNQSVATGVGGNGLNGCHAISSTPTSTTLTFPTNAAPATYTDSELIVSPGFPQPLWGSWGTPPPHNSVGSRTGGTVTANAGIVVLTRGGSGTNSSFNTAWAVGTRIFINGSSPTCASNLCTIASVQDATDLTLQESLTVRDAAWSNADFSLLVKKATSTGAVSVSAGYDMAYSAMYGSGLDGSGDICNSNLVTTNVDAIGNSISPLQGYLCVAANSQISSSGWIVYLFIPSTGETRMIARNWQASLNDYTSWIGWHPTDGKSWFVNKSGQNTFYKAAYTGDFRSLTPGYIQIGTESATPEQITFTDIFAGAGNDVTSQIANCQTNNLCDHGINPNIFTLPPQPPQTGAAIRGNYMVLCGAAGIQDSPGYVTYWNLGVVPAQLTWAGYSWDKFPVGYGGIHACFNIGTGQFNITGINASLGQIGAGNLRGPWQATPTMADKTGNGYVSDTSIRPTDGFFCPDGLSAKWQALGAKPQASGGLPLCLKLKIPGEPCSVHATSIEHTTYPCPWSSDPNTSMLKPIAEGDTVHDAALGWVSWGEYMLVVKKAVNSPTDIDLWMFRYRMAPAANFACGSNVGSDVTHSNGWSFHAAPYQACAGINAWSNAADSTRTWFADTQLIFGSHSDFGEGSTSYTYAGGATLTGYLTRANQAMPDQIGQAPTAQISANPMFGSTTSSLPDVFLQSYSSKRQRRVLAPLAEMDWALDVRSYNPSGGASAENPENLFGNTITLMSGTSNTYLITFPVNQIPDPKRVGFVGWAGYHALADKSGPSSRLGDSDLWRYCYAFTAEECVPGSTQGNMYVSIPQASVSAQCTVNSYAFNAPCISNHYPYGFWVTQWNTLNNDAVGISSRRLTSALIAPGRQYNFTNAKSTPDGKWAQVQAEWLEGQRTDIFWAKIPPFPASPSQPASGKIVLVLSGITGDSVAVSFGYAENGDPASLFCTTRAEACFTSAAATTANPFVYGSEAPSFTPCSAGCEIAIPAIPGRILYYQVIRKNGGITSTSALGATGVL